MSVVSSSPQRTRNVQRMHQRTPVDPDARASTGCLLVQCINLQSEGSHWMSAVGATSLPCVATICCLHTLLSQLKEPQSATMWQPHLACANSQLHAARGGGQSPCGWPTPPVEPVCGWWWIPQAHRLDTKEDMWSSHSLLSTGWWQPQQWGEFACPWCVRCSRSGVGFPLAVMSSMFGAHWLRIQQSRCCSCRHPVCSVSHGCLQWHLG